MKTQEDYLLQKRYGKERLEGISTSEPDYATGTE